MSEKNRKASFARKLRKKTGILNDEEVAAAATLVRDQLAAAFGSGLNISSQRIEDVVRWSSLRARCEQEREKLGLSIKDVSSKLKIPQYRLRAIENGTIKEFKPEMALEYFRFLGIQKWLARWSKANKELAVEAGIISRADDPGESGE